MSASPAILLALVFMGCATRSFVSLPIEDVPFRDRAQTQKAGGIRVTVAVPSAEETQRIFGVPTYDRDIQPVWIEVKNGSTHRLRFAPVGVDRDYFAPLEVPYMFRSGFSKEARGAMNTRFDELAMERRIRAGETQSGFVFTHASLGTKSINVDLFGADYVDHSFTFFVDVPGFTPDHAPLDFEALYDPGDVRDLDLGRFRQALYKGECCAKGPGGEGAGQPINVVMVGRELEALHALLRAGWYEIRRPETPGEVAESQHLYGRPPDAVFRLQRSGSGVKGDRNELRVWMAPLRVEGLPVWMGQVNSYIGRSTELERALFDARLDPDIDNARDYMLQVMWYSQGLARNAWVATAPAVPSGAMQRDFRGARFFTDGLAAVLWLSGSPVSLREVDSLDWDNPTP